MKQKYSLYNNIYYVFISFFKIEKRLIWYILIFVMTGILMPLIGAVMPAYIVSLIEGGCSWQVLLKTICIGFVLYGVVSMLFQYTDIAKVLMMSGSKFYFCCPQLYEKSLRMDYQLFETEKVKVDLNKATYAAEVGDFNGLSGFAIYIVEFMKNFLGMMAYVCLIGQLNHWMVLMLLGISVIRMLIFNYAKKYEQANKDKKAKFMMISKYLSRQAQDISAGKDIRLYQLHHLLTSIYRKTNKNYDKVESKERGLYFFSDTVGLLLDLMRDALCYGYIFLMINQGLSIASLIFYINLVRGFGNWTTSLSNQMSQIARCHLSVSDFRFYIDHYSLDTTAKKTLEALNKPWKIELKDLCFKYENSERMIIHHLNLVIQPHEKLAIIGLNGAGKTTLIKLICGLYHPTSGQILINGIDIETINREQLFSYISAIFQDAFFLAHTIKENIILSNHQKDEKRYQDVLRQAGLSDKLSNLPKRDETYLYKDISEDGIQISGGEFQKILLSRAIYKPSQLLILDEPTAALDAIAESEMYQKYQQIVDDKTSIFISHRLASTQFCDRILFFENGQVLEEGNHQELLELNGQYAHLYKVQSQYYEEEVK